MYIREKERKKVKRLDEGNYWDMKTEVWPLYSHSTVFIFGVCWSTRNEQTETK